MVQSVATHLMFTGDASAALELYAAIFPEFRVEQIDRYGPGDPGAGPVPPAPGVRQARGPPGRDSRARGRPFGRMSRSARLVGHAVIQALA